MQICVLFGVNQSAHLLNLAHWIFLKVMEKVMESCGISLLKMYNLCDRECNSDLLALNLTQLGG